MREIQAVGGWTVGRHAGIGRRGFIGAGMASLLAGNLLARTAEDEVKFCAFAAIHYYPGMFPHDTR